MPFELPVLSREAVFRYIKPDDNEALLELADGCERELRKSISPQYTYRIFEHLPIKDAGNDIKAHLAGSKKTALFAATLGSTTDALIRRAEVNRISEAYIYDALANVAIETLCDYVMLKISEKYPEYTLTTRYSPGYGDFPIEAQTEFLELLSANKKTGLYLTDNYLMIPKKSVTAVVGLKGDPCE